MRNLLSVVSIILASVLFMGMVLAEEQAKDKTDISKSFPLLKVVGLSGAEVEKVLGKANKWEKSKYGPKGLYLDNAVEIVFIKNKADWITVYPTGSGIRFHAKDVTLYLGLDSKKPQLANQFTIRWNGINGLAEVSAFPDWDNKKMVGYLYVLGRTK